MEELLRAPRAEEEPRRLLGVCVRRLPEALRAHLGLGEKEGVLVIKVQAGSLAEKAGLKKHDIILKLGKKTVEDRWQFRRDVRRALAGDAFTVEVLRGGKRQTLQVGPGGE
ncbi:MAG: PDZ domain-containing protein [Planctomycetota bacterium]|jgi:S1-C subfamily serine protease